MLCILSRPQCVSFIPGCRQALLLTKTQPFDGLPPSVESLLGAVEIPHQVE